MAKILIVDDSPLMVEMLKKILTEDGHEVLSAGDGATALSMVKADSPNLIILDVMLPGLDGYKVCRMIKFDELLKHIPVILFTSKASDEDRALGKEVGADDYLTKDFEPAGIKEIVKKHLNSG